MRPEPNAQSVQRVLSTLFRKVAAIQHRDQRHQGSMRKPLRCAHLCHRAPQGLPGHAVQSRCRLPPDQVVRSPQPRSALLVIPQALGVSRFPPMGLLPRAPRRNGIDATIEPRPLPVSQMKAPILALEEPRHRHRGLMPELHRVFVRFQRAKGSRR